jgi:hypothetical protein
VGRVVGEVGVHLEQHVIIARQAPLEARSVCFAQALFGAAMQREDPAIMLRGQPVGQLTRAVGRIVVHHEDVIRPPGKYLLHQGLQVFYLVVGGKYDERVQVYLYLFN